jgi:uncharacterized repeat protein (TIGR03803 family)
MSPLAHGTKPLCDRFLALPPALKFSCRIPGLPRRRCYVHHYFVQDSRCFTKATEVSRAENHAIDTYRDRDVVHDVRHFGQFSVVHSFCQTLDTFYCADGDSPTSLVLGSDGNLYRTTQYGGDPPSGGRAIGTIFRSTPDGTVTTLYTFCTQDGCPDGAWPNKLVQDTDGTFFGVTESSPSTIFKFAAGLPPFVKTLPRFGKVGTTAIVAGNNLSSTTSVTFNGTAATFTVLSNNEIKATVPAGATTGQFTVTAAQGTVASDVVFTVVP